MVLHAQLEAVTDTSAIVVTDEAQGHEAPRPFFTVDDVLPHRSASKPPSVLVAGFSDADSFKSKGARAKPKAKRWDHRLSAESKSRTPSSLKGAMKYFRPGTVSLCGGLPSSTYFPLEQVSSKQPVAPYFSEAEAITTSQVFSSGKYDTHDGESLSDLSIALNYGQAMGPAALMRFLTEHTEIVHRPPYSDWDICVTAGSTSALEIALRMLTERGDHDLTEEYTFSTAIETVSPLGAKMLGVKMDAQGMLPDDLDDILSTWDEATRGARKPFLVYAVPTGQNPTSSTQPLERRQQIYQVAEKHDLIIIEDEPYFFLQMEPFVPGRTSTVATPFQPAPISEFLHNLVPSYLSLDTSGRVLRMDSFSKIIAPGSRTGWVTGSTQLIERFMRHNEVSVQNPSGFSTSILYNLLECNWGHKGFLEWLMYLRAEYTRRRDILLNACEMYLPPEVTSWSPPMAGMFHWIRVDATQHPSIQEGAQLDHAKLLEIEDQVFLAVVEEEVLVAKGSWFRAQRGSDTEVFIRTTFAAPPADRMVLAMCRVGKAIRREFGLPALSVDDEANVHAK